GHTALTCTGAAGPDRRPRGCRSRVVSSSRDRPRHQPPRHVEPPAGHRRGPAFLARRARGAGRPSLVRAGGGAGSRGRTRGGGRASAGGAGAGGVLARPGSARAPAGGLEGSTQRRPADRVVGTDAPVRTVRSLAHAVVRLAAARKGAPPPRLRTGAEHDAVI